MGIFIEVNAPFHPLTQGKWPASLLLFLTPLGLEGQEEDRRQAGGILLWLTLSWGFKLRGPAPV